jgi:hypothetical protein
MGKIGSCRLLGALKLELVSPFRNLCRVGVGLMAVTQNLRSMKTQTGVNIPGSENTLRA